MISTEQIADFVAHPAHVQLAHVSELEDLSNKHPYAQLFSILTLKGLANEKDARFDEILLNHSYRIADRVQLYNLVHKIDDINKPAIAVSESIEAQTDLETAPVEEEIILEEKLELAEIETKEKIVVESTHTPSEIIDAESNYSPENEIVEETVSEEETEVAIEDAKEEMFDPILEENILHHAYANSFQLEELSAEEEEQLSHRENQKDKVETIEAKKGLEEEAVSFNSWLHANKNYSHKEDSDTAAIHALVNEFKDFDPLEDLTGEVKKPKREFFSPAKKAKESLREETIPVSETLAKIYVLQGNYPKAIEAYHQLSLNFPEKKIFFANLIKDLHKKLNT